MSNFDERRAKAQQLGWIANRIGYKVLDRAIRSAALFEAEKLVVDAASGPVERDPYTDPHPKSSRALDEVIEAISEVKEDSSGNRIFPVL